ncbi:MAG TPA: ADOP family duplicated permease [Gemmatimonadaceae bacterium]|nr:ADOP family duplicated permease [Gemmatimonadaceae bacterium]
MSEWLDTLLSEFRHRLRALIRRDAVERDLDDELRFHIEREAEKYVHAGESRDSARRRATLAFGGVERIKDDTRDTRGVGFVERAMHDARFAFRGIRRRPMFAAVVITTLALGVGINAAMFGVVDRLLFRPPAYLRDPGSVNRLYVAWTTDRGRGWLRIADYAEFADFTRWSRSVSQTAAFCYYNLAVGSGDDLKESSVGIVTASLFDFFDAKPVLGRFFTEQEDSPPAGEAVAVLAYDYWQTQYAGRRDVLGSKLAIGRGTYTIIGVAPKGFDGISDQQPPVAFVPVAAYATAGVPTGDNAQRARWAQRGYDWWQTYDAEWLEILVRRRRGTSVDAASADLTNAFHRSWLARAAIEPNLPSFSSASPVAVAGPLQLGRGPLAESEARVVVWITGVAFIVLLIACANVANLLLARALRRRREIAVRQALGGSRRRLIEQLLTETLILAALGGVAGLLVAQACSVVLGRMLLGSVGAFGVLTDWRTLVFSLSLIVFVALVAGSVPALHQGTGHLADSLKAGVREGNYRQSQTRTMLLIVQAALSVVLLVGAGLFARSVHQVRSLRLGFDVNPIVYVRTNVRGMKLSDSERAALSVRLLDEARAIPGVVAATRTVSVPFGTSESRTLSAPGIDSIPRSGRITLQAGSPDYFTTVGTRIVRGRGLETGDRAGAPPIIVVSTSLAAGLWGTQDPIGKCIRVGGDTMPCRTVVGVAEDVTSHQLTGEPKLTYYLSVEQRAVLFGPETPALFVRVAGRADDYAERIRARLQPLMPGASYVRATTMREKVDSRMRSWNLGATLFLAFGALALGLAAVGLYAVIAFSVAQRAHELGVRIALGARVSDILRLVVGEGVAFTVAGVVIGGAIALGAGHWVQPLLFDVAASDPLTYALVAVALIVVGVLASAIPAARAARVDPTVALRTD